MNRTENILTSGLAVVAGLVAAWLAHEPGALLLAAAVPLIVVVSLRATEATVAGILWSVLVSHRAFSLRGEALSDVGTALSSAPVEVASTLLVFGAAVVLTARRLQRREVLLAEPALRWMSLYVSIAAVSLLWVQSVTYAGFWMLRLVASLLLLDGMVGARATSGQVAGWTVLGTLPYAGLVWLAYVRGFQYTGGRLAGCWLHPGVAAISLWSVGVLGIGMAMNLESRPRVRVTWAVAAVVATSGALIAGGKAGALGAAVGLFVLITAAPSVSSRLRVVSLLSVAALAGGWWAWGAEFGLVRHLILTRNTTGLATLYGRFDLWAGAMQSWASDPLSALLGKGFTSTRMSGIPTLSRTWSSDHAHNSFIQTLIETGIVGLLAIILVMISTLRRAILFRRENREGAVARALLASMTVLLVGALSDNVFGGLILPTTYMFFGLAASVAALGHGHE